MTYTIPIVSMASYAAGNSSRDSFVTVLGESAHRVGFFAVIDHGIPVSLLEKLRYLARRVFALPDAAKRAYEHADIGRQIGYAAIRTETAAGENEPDKKEFWHIRPDWHQLGHAFPSEVPEFGPACLELISHLERVAHPLLWGLRKHLDKEFPLVRTYPDFAELAREGDSLLRVLHYPDIQGEQGMRAAAHADINWITLLTAADRPGLQVRLRGSEGWVDVVNPPEAIVVNIGDMLEVASCGYYRSTPHRVVDPETPDGGRISMPYFVHPKLGSILMDSGTFLRHRLKEIGAYETRD